MDQAGSKVKIKNIERPQEAKDIEKARKPSTKRINLKFMRILAHTTADTARRTIKFIRRSMILL
jgi:hypothetical protein